MTSKTLTLGLVAAALLMMAGGRANAQASPAHDPLAIWVSNNAFITNCVDNAPCDHNPAVGTIQLDHVNPFGLTWDDLTVKSSATRGPPVYAQLRSVSTCRLLQTRVATTRTAEIS